MKSWPAVALVVACTGKPEPPPPVLATVPADAAIDGITSIGTWDPASGSHVDDDGATRPPTRPPPPRASHAIDVTLRSTPPKAHATVDGVPIGDTPTYWAGEANGRPHEFTFSLSGYATARYVFVPVASGIVHAHLDQVTGELDAGVSTEPPTDAPQYPSRHTVPVDASIGIDATASGDGATSGLGPAN